MPPAPPVRAAAGNYHFHTYDYPGSAGNGPWGLSPAQPQRGGWQFYSMVQDLTGLRNYGASINVPNITLTNVGGPTVRGRRTKMLSFGNLGNVPGRPTVVITGGIHAREWAATEMVYLIAEYLIANYAAPLAPNPRRQRIRDLVNHRNIHIIPMVNPDGNRRTVFGTGANDRLWRKNRHRLPWLGQTWRSKLAPGGVATQPFANVQLQLPAQARYDVPSYAPPGVPPGAAVYQNHVLPNGEIGVDLNRNMHTTGWGYDCAPNFVQWDPAGEQYFGTRPGGERETSNLQVAMANAAGGPGGNIAVAVDYHSFGRFILYPGEVAYAPGIPPLHTSTGQMLQALIRNAMGIHAYQLGVPLALVGYDGTGSVADYAAQQHAARSFTIEVDPSLLSPVAFQLPENQIQGVFEKNIRGALAAIAAPANAMQAAFFQIHFAWNVFNQGNQVP
jgi:hypothetical protein